MIAACLRVSWGHADERRARANHRAEAFSRPSLHDKMSARDPVFDGVREISSICNVKMFAVQTAVLRLSAARKT